MFCFTIVGMRRSKAVMLRTRDWKLITRQPELAREQNGMRKLPEAFAATKRVNELYHLADDPSEKTNLARAHPREMEKLQQRLQTYLDQDPGLPRQRQELDEVTKERLRSLGYLE